MKKNVEKVIKSNTVTSAFTPQRMVNAGKPPVIVDKLVPDKKAKRAIKKGKK